MTSLSIKQLGDPVLRVICQPVDNTTDVLQTLDDMTETLRTNPKGAALAAPQIGSTQRLVVVNAGHRLMELINPRIINTYGQQKGRESCLSLPGMFGIVKRFRHIRVNALNRLGQDITFDAKGFLARCLQHEIDHLDGILFIDHVIPGQLYDTGTKEPVDVARLLAISKNR